MSKKKLAIVRIVLALVGLAAMSAVHVFGGKSPNAGDIVALEHKN